MPSSSSSPRIGALVSLAGVALILLGFFLPMFTQSNPQVPGSVHPVYEWDFLPLSSGFPLFALFAIPAALPLLGMLIILATSVATLFGVSLPRLLWLKRAAAGGGLAIQLFFAIFVFVLSHLGYAHTEIAWGFVMVPLGFLIMVIGVFVLQVHPGEVPDSSSSLRLSAVVSLVGVILVPLDVFALLLIGISKIEIGWGFVVVPLGFLVMAIGVFVLQTDAGEVPDSSSSLRLGAVVSLVGVVLILLGSFLPMFTLTALTYPQHVPVYEWQVNGDPSNVSLTVLFAVLATLPLLGMLIILATSAATLFGVSLPRLLWLKRAAAAWGLAAQLLFDAFVLLLVGDLFGLRPESFVVALLGLVMGAFVVETYQKQKRAHQVS